MTGRQRQSRCLVVGTEFGRIDVGVAANGHWDLCESRRENAVEGLAPLLRQVLKRSGLHPLEATEWIYSGGPGSLLSLRAMSMILESWTAVSDAGRIPRRRYSGMVWTARHLLRQGVEAPFSLISPWRIGTWNVLRVSNGKPPTERDLTVVEGNPDPVDPVYCLGSRPGSQPPPDAETVDLPSFSTLMDELADEDFLRKTPAVEPIQSGTTTYRRWEAKPHTAP